MSLGGLGAMISRSVTMCQPKIIRQMCLYLCQWKHKPCTHTLEINIKHSKIASIWFRASFHHCLQKHPTAIWMQLTLCSDNPSYKVNFTVTTQYELIPPSLPFTVLANNVLWQQIYRQTGMGSWTHLSPYFGTVLHSVVLPSCSHSRSACAHLSWRAESS